MDSTLDAFMIFIGIFALFSMLIYLLFRVMGGKEKVKSEIKSAFNAKERDGTLIFKYRGYDVMVTFKPDVKVSVLHNKNVEDVKAPKGAKLTPLYLIFRIKKSRELGEKLDRYTEFLDSIPTQ